MRIQWPALRTIPCRLREQAGWMANVASHGRAALGDRRCHSHFVRLFRQFSLHYFSPRRFSGDSCRSHTHPFGTLAHPSSAFRPPSLIFSGMLLLTLMIYSSYGRMNTFIDDFPEYADRIQDVIEPLKQNIEKDAEDRRQSESGHTGTQQENSRGAHQRAAQLAVLPDSRRGHGVGCADRRRGRAVPDVLHAGAEGSSLQLAGPAPLAQPSMSRDSPTGSAGWCTAL